MHKLRVLCGAAMLAACLAPAAHADEWNKLTYFTFSGPVEMPGITLPAGSYKFELADPDTTRRVVRVSDKEGTKVHGTFLSISNQMMEPADKPLVMFKEMPAGGPEAVKAWFYPGESIGYEFVYPHDQALKIAKATRSAVLTAKGEVTGTTLASDTTRIDENGVESASTTTASASTSTTASTTSTTASTSTTAPPATTAEAATSTTAATTIQPAPPAPPASVTTTAAGTTSTTTAGTASTTTASAAAAPAPPTTPEAPAPPAPTTTTAQAVQAPATIAPQPVTTPRETTITEPAAPVATAGEAPAPAARTELPRTASPLPLIELFSGLALAGGFAFRALRKALA